MFKKDNLLKVMEKKEMKSGILFTIFIFLFLIFSVFSGLFLILSNNKDYSVISSFLSYVVSTVLLFLVSKALIPNEKEKIFNKFNPIYLLFAIILAFGMMFGFGFINSLFSIFMEKLGVSMPATEIDLSSFPKYIFNVVALAVTPAVFEEIVFRHFILKGIKGNIIIGSLLSAFCFSLYHFSLSQFIYQFIYGFFLSVLAIKSGSIIPGILAHFINNFIVLTLEYFKLNINLFSWWVILIGLFLTAIFIFYTLIYKREKAQEKVEVIPFVLGAGVGFIVCISMLVGGLIG